ncbi:MAG TPA: glycosyltransferase family 1 protein [Sulfurospirillum arcachonense]|nr:glycosyltransferase family 1 protein [Sulfurospirillum arcachonense]HIP44682.1 glycosyltransferase family 1 protein [Sulfurospirillum arcachonense]
MHILMVSLDFIPTVGGITAHVYELSRALIKNNCQITIITRAVEGRDLFEKIDGMDVYRVDLKFTGMSYGLQINRYIKKHLKKINPDLIHIHGMRPLEFYNVKNIPLVYTNHTSGYLKRIKKGGYRIPLLKKLFKKPKLFLAPSEELLKIPFEIEAIKAYIPNGVVSEKFKRNLDNRAKIRKNLNLKNEDILAIVTRRMVWKNGVKYLALATQFIKNKNLKLLFIGDGEEFNEIKSILEKNFKDRFFMLGSKEHDEIIEYYSASDLSILPSLMEATSISGLEAMAASLPLVGTRVGGIPKLIKDNYTGYLCEPGNPKDLALKIDLLLNSDYKKMGQNASTVVKENFDWNTIAKSVINEYKRVL